MLLLLLLLELLLELLGRAPSPIDANRQDRDTRDMLYDARHSQGTSHCRSSDKSGPQCHCNT